MSKLPTLISKIKKTSKALDRLRFGGEVACVYNPLSYAWAPHLEFIKRYGTGNKRVLFLGMNPGPYGMVQTGVPFGEIQLVKHWLKIEEPVNQPKKTHPKRPIQGFECSKTEVSGQRFLGMISERFSDPMEFFKDSFVVNFCPLVWMTETGKNITPDKLPAEQMGPVYLLCNDLLESTLRYYQPEILVGVGAFAEKQLKQLVKTRFKDTEFKIGRMLHPSPASPLANKHWPDKAIKDLVELGVWN